MKRIHWWTIWGVSGTGLAALLLSQSVMGQPEAPLPLPPTLMKKDVSATKVGETRPVVSTPSVPVRADGQVPSIPAVPLAPSRPGSEAPLPKPPQSMLIVPPVNSSPLPVVAQSPPAPLVLKAEGAPLPPLVPVRTEKQPSAPISFEVQPGKQQPSLSVEWTGPTTIRIRQPMACQLVVRNTSSAPAQNVVVRHRLARGVSCKACEPLAANEMGELVWNLGTLAPDQVRRIDLTLIAQARGPLNCPALVTFSAVAAHQVQVREPQLTIKMRAPDKVIVGETVTLLFAVSNPGDGVTESVKLKTLLPDGLEHPSGKKVIEFEVGNLAPKEIRTMQLACLAKGSGLQKTSIVATGEGNLSSNDTAQLEILMPRLEVAMSGPKLRYLDRHAVYVLKVTNPGSAPASSVEVQELIPSGFKFHQANHGGQYQEGTRLVSWKLGDLPAGQTKEIAVDLIPVETGEHRLMAQAKATRGLRSQAETRTTVEGISALFIEVADVDDPIEVGAETAYEIRVANTGTKTETNVEVVCTLPPQFEFRGARCSTTLRFRQEGRDLIFEPLPRLAPKAEVIYRVQVRGVAAGDVRFRTRIKSDGLKESVLREESTRIYSDEAPPRPAAPASAAPKLPMPKPASLEPAAPVVPPAPTSAAPLLPLTAPVAPPLPDNPLPAPAPAIPAPAAPSSNPVPLPTPLPTPLPSGLPTPLPIPPGN